MKRIFTDFQHHVDPTQLKIRGTNFYDLFFCHPLVFFLERKEVALAFQKGKKQRRNTNLFGEVRRL
jgi:hypothetical protein